MDKRRQEIYTLLLSQEQVYTKRISKNNDRIDSPSIIPRNKGSIPGRVILKTQKMVFDALSTIRWGSRVKWCNPWNGIAPSPTP